jgi:hypothetical protein
MYYNELNYKPHNIKREISRYKVIILTLKYHDTNNRLNNTFFFQFTTRQKVYYSNLNMYTFYYLL